MLPRYIEREALAALDRRLAEYENIETFEDLLRALDVRVHSGAERRGLSGMVSRDIEQRRRLAIERENRAWEQVKTRRDWERFRDQRIDALRRSLGQELSSPGKIDVHVTARRIGDGHRIENLAFESRPGLLVTADLYVPLNAPTPMPAVIIAVDRRWVARDALEGS
jgi:hypothetical protein